MDKAIGTLGLARKSGNLILGFDAVKESMKNEKSQGVIIACDLSEKTEKNIVFEAKKYGVKIFKSNYTMEELSQNFSKKVGIFSIESKGLFLNFCKNSINT